MIDNILAWTPGLLELLIILILFVIPVILIVLFIKYMLRNSEERRKLRIELGKLADELEKLREQAEGGKRE